MNSKDTILSKIKKNLPSVSGEDINLDFKSDPIPEARFPEALKSVGGKYVYTKDMEDWKSWVKSNYGIEINLYSEIEKYPGNQKFDGNVSKKQLNSIDVAVLQGELGVAENGAIWISKFLHRSIPFITQHLIIVLNQSNIIATMHNAYAELLKEEMPDYGVFISGPSKTADIEQSLVHGAHGPRTLTVILN